MQHTDVGKLRHAAVLQPARDRMSTADELYALLSPLAPYDAQERLAKRLLE